MAQAAQAATVDPMIGAIPDTMGDPEVQEVQVVQVAPAVSDPASPPSLHLGFSSTCNIW